MNLLRKVAWSFHRTTGHEFDDLFQEAALAFLQAMETYNPARGKITTHVWHCVNSQLKNYLKQTEQARCRHYNTSLHSLEDVRVKKPVNGNLFFDQLSREAIEVAEIIIHSPTKFSTMKTEDAQHRVRSILLARGWFPDKVHLGLLDLKRACR